jgi:hypothetical protein
VLYINYGVPKSGSTLTFEMTLKLLELAGHRQFALPAEIRNDKTGRTHYTNTVRDWTDEVIAALEGAAPNDSILLVRTHHLPTEAAARLVARDGARLMVGIRDPRDIALSMLDVVTRLGEKGRAHTVIQPGALESTFSGLDVHAGYCATWAGMQGALILDYEQTAFSHAVTLDAISAQLGLGDNSEHYPAAFAAATERMEPKKYVARPHRHRREMSASDQQMFLDRYASFYERFYPDAKVVVEDDDERELAIIAERRQWQRAREAERQARIDARAAAPQGGRLDRAAIREQRAKEREARQAARVAPLPSDTRTD